MIIKVIQDSAEHTKNAVSVYCYEADSYVYVDDGCPEHQCVVIFKDGKQIGEFCNPIFNRVFICNNNGKTVDSYVFAPIGAEGAVESK